MWTLNKGFVAAILILGVGLSLGKPCDLKKIEDGWYCPSCDEILKPDGRENGVCKECRDEAMDESDVEKAEKVKVCVKSYHECRLCQSRGQAGASCKECGEKYEEVTVRARIIWACENCETWYKEGESCEDEECVRLKTKVVRTCTESGAFPHTRK